MDERTLLQLVPALPPPYEGVGSHALRLAEALETGGGMASRFLVLGPGGGDAEDRPGVFHLRERTGPALRRLVDRALASTSAPRVLLHYSNYGYAPRGCPRWLAAGLESWRRETSDGRLVTVFHEVSAAGAPWQSSFWLRPVQRRIAARVARASDAAVTSLERYASELRHLGAPAPPEVLPVFSAVGEPRDVPALADRPRRLVVFGGPGTRSRAYREHRDELEIACRSLDVEEIVDVGPALDDEVEWPGRPPVRRRGPLDSREVRRVLLGARAGFLAYPREFLPKSTVFAAYCAHGLLPVQAWRPEAAARAESPSPLAWVPSARRLMELDGGGQALADRARAWYRPHRLEAQAALFRHLLDHGAGS